MIESPHTTLRTSESPAKVARVGSLRAAPIGRIPKLRIVERPGFSERILVIALIFINQFGTPASWFTENTGSASGPDSDSLLTVGTLVGVSILLFGLVGNGDALVRVLSADTFANIFVFLIIASPFWSDYFGESLAGAVNFSLMFAFAMILVVRFTLRDVIGLSAIASIIGLTLDMMWILALGPLGRSSSGAWDGLATQKNGLGNHGVIGVLVLLLAARTFRRFRVPLYSFAGLALVILIGSASKTSLAAGILTACALVVYVAFRSKKTLFGAVLFTLVTTSTVAVAFATANIGLIASWLNKDVTLTGRTDFWPVVVDAIKARPILGYGYDGFFRGPLSPAHDVIVQVDWGPTHAHNAFLQIGLHVGLVGLFFFLAMNVRALIRATNHVRWVKGPAGLFPIVYLTLSLMLSFTESGVIGQRYGLALFFVAVYWAPLGTDTAKSHIRAILPPSDRESDESDRDESAPQVRRTHQPGARIPS